MSLPAEEIEYQKTHINDDRRKDVVIALVISLSAACLAVVLRFVARRLAKARLGWDDWTLLLGLVHPLPRFSYSY